MLSSKKLILFLTAIVLSISLFLVFPLKVSALTFSDQVVSNINSERQKQGLTPLNNSNKLSEASKNHNATMLTCSKTYGVAACFTHQVTQLSEPNFFDRIKATLYHPQSAAENIAWGYTTPASVVSGWMGSSGHRANILGNYKDIGCDYLDGLNGSYQGMYWTCDFGISSYTNNVVPTTTPTPTNFAAPTPTPVTYSAPSTQKPWWCIYVPTYPLCR